MPAEPALSLPSSTPILSSPTTPEDANAPNDVPDDPDKFYRQYKPPSANLPDIFVDRSVGNMARAQMSTMSTMSKRKAQAITDNGSRRTQATGRPVANYLRSSSTPVKLPTTSTVDAKQSSPVVVAATSKQRGSVKDIANHFNKSSSPAESPYYTKSISQGSRTPSSAVSQTSSPLRNGRDISLGSPRKSRDTAKLQSEVASQSNQTCTSTLPAKASEHHWSASPEGHTELSLRSITNIQQLQDIKRPLFGEVDYNNSVMSSCGNEMPKGRSNISEKETRSPNSSPISSNRRAVQSRYPTQDNSPFGAPLDKPDSFGKVKQQSGSNSDYSLPAVNPNHKSSTTPQSPVSPVKSPLSPRIKVRNSPSSKIPIPIRRSSITPSDPSSDPPSTEICHSRTPSSPSRVARLQPAIHSNQNNATYRPSTPSARRYDPRANKSPTNNASLAAYISVPLPKKSPPLRSSRPRQPVSLTPTNSKPEVVEQATSETVYASMHHEPLSRRDQSTLSSPSSVPNMNTEILLERKSSIIQAMNSNEKRLAHSRSLSIKTMQESCESHTTGFGNHLRDSENEKVQHAEASRISADRPKLSVDINSIPDKRADEPLTGVTEIEIETESPVVGKRRGSDLDLLPSKTYNPLESRSKPHSVSTDCLSKTNIPNEVTDLASELTLRAQPTSLRDHMLEVRSTTASTTSHTDFGEDSRSESSESIKIVLGATPTACTHGESWTDADESDLAMLKNHDTWDDELITPESCTDYIKPERSVFGKEPDKARCDSILPDDSISVRHNSGLNLSLPEGIDTLAGRTGESMLNKDTYTTVNRVLEQYYTTEVVTSDMAHNFRRQVYDVSPSLAQFDSWRSKGATQRYLERLIQESLVVYSDENSEHDSFHYNRSMEQERFKLEETLNAEDFYIGGTALIFQDEQGINNGVSHSSSRRLAGRPTPPPKDRSSPLYPTRVIEKGGDKRAHIVHKNQNIGGQISLSINASNHGIIMSKPQPPPPANSLPELPPLPPPLPPSQENVTSSLPPPPPVPTARSPSLYDKNPPSSIFATTMPNGAFAHVQAYERIIDRPHADRSLSTSEAAPLRPPNPVREATSLSEAEAPSRKVSGTNADSDQKRLRQRWNLIKELVDTEFSFSSDMHVVENIYKGTSLSCRDIDEEDKSVLFGNSEQVVTFSEEFYSYLKHASAAVYIPARNSRWNIKRSSTSTSNSGINEPLSDVNEPISEEDDEKTFIGQIFNDHMARMEFVYGEYLRNHDSANQRLSKLQAMPNVDIWLKECGEQIQDITKAWSLDSLLVKPVQRLLKYPLLLKQLIDNTPDTHPDYAALNTAFINIKDASQRMNDSKRRDGFADPNQSRKRKDSEPKFNLTKFLRSEKLKQSGSSSTISYDDPIFNELSAYWGRNYLNMQIIMRDYRNYSRDLQTEIEQFIRYVGAMEAFLDIGQTSSYEIESKWRKFAMAIREIAATALTEHKRMIRHKIIDKFTTLIHELDNYMKLIEKRKKRLVDYTRYRNLKDRKDKIDRKLHDSVDQYISLNDMLKKALPQLYKLCGTFCMATLHQFIVLQLKWQKAWEIKLKAVIDESEIPKDLTMLVESFLSDFSFSENQLSRLGICNGSLLSNIGTFTPYSVLHSNSDDGASSSKRRSSSIQTGHRTMSVNSETTSLPTPDANRRQSGSRLLYPFSEIVPPMPSPPGRARANSAVSSHGPLTPPSLPRPGQIPPRPSTSTDRSSEQHHGYVQNDKIRSSQGDSAAAIAAAASLHPQTATELQDQDPFGMPFMDQQKRRQHGEQQLWPELEGSNTPLIRFSGIFSSALPMSESPVTTEQPEVSGFSEPDVLFWAASKYEFKIDRTRTEAGYPFLGYDEGEVFDIIGQKGELWLARNQDDPDRTIGWVWDKHFVRCEEAVG